MGSYTTRNITKEECNLIVKTLRSGYTDRTGHVHRPNNTAAAAMVLQSNLGIRIGDIVSLRMENIVRDGEIWRLDFQEQKTGKRRTFLVPDELHQWLAEYCLKNRRGPQVKIFDLTARALQMALSDVCKHLQIENVSTHSFRKFAANRIYEASGHDIELTREFLQHASPQTTVLYLKRSRPQMEAAIAGILNLI